MVHIPPPPARKQIDLSTMKINFGKYKGASFKELWSRDASYIDWMAKKDVGVIGRFIPTVEVNGRIFADADFVEAELFGRAQPNTVVEEVVTQPIPINTDSDIWFGEFAHLSSDPLADFSWISFP